MESSMPGLCRASRYNHAFPYKGEMLLFNGLSSALTVLPCPVFEQVESYLFAAQPFDPESVGDPDLRTTLEGLRGSQVRIADALGIERLRGEEITFDLFENRARKHRESGAESVEQQHFPFIGKR